MLDVQVREAECDTNARHVSSSRRELRDDVINTIAIPRQLVRAHVATPGSHDHANQIRTDLHAGGPAHRSRSRQRTKASWFPCTA